MGWGAEEVCVVLEAMSEATSLVLRIGVGNTSRIADARGRGLSSRGLQSCYSEALRALSRRAFVLPIAPVRHPYPSSTGAQLLLLASDGYDGYDTRAAGPEPFSQDALQTRRFLPASKRGRRLSNTHLSGPFFLLSGTRGWPRTGAEPRSYCLSTLALVCG